MAFILVNLGTGTDTKNSPSLPSRGCTLVEFYKAIECKELIDFNTQIISESLFPAVTADGAASAAGQENPNGTSKAIVDGPDTAGSQVYSIAAKSLMLTLAQVAQGETNILMYGHSRGSVITCVTTQCIEIIRKTIAANPEKSDDEIFRLITASHSDDDDTVTKVKALLVSKEYKTNLEKIIPAIKKNISAVKVSLFGLDPVPGGFNGATNTGWFTPAPYELSKYECVNQYEFYYQKHEVSYAFPAAIVPGVEGKGKVDIMPGNHATPQGKLGTQNNGDFCPVGLTDDKAANLTPLVQEVLLMKAMYFGKVKAHLKYSPESVSIALPVSGQKWHGKLGEKTLRSIVGQFNSFVNDNFEIKFQEYLYQQYNEMYKVVEFFEQFRDYTYTALGSLAHIGVVFATRMGNWYRWIYGSSQVRLVDKSDRLVIVGTDKQGYQYASLSQHADSCNTAINQEHFELQMQEVKKLLPGSQILRSLLSQQEHNFEQVLDLTKQLIDLREQTQHTDAVDGYFKLFSAKIIRMLGQDSLNHTQKISILALLKEWLTERNDDTKKMIRDEIFHFFTHSLDLAVDLSQPDTTNRLTILLQLKHKVEKYNSVVDSIFRFEQSITYLGSDVELVTPDQYKIIVNKFMATKSELINEIQSLKAQLFQGEGHEIISEIQQAATQLESKQESPPTTPTAINEEEVAGEEAIKTSLEAIKSAVAAIEKMEVSYETTPSPASAAGAAASVRIEEYNRWYKAFSTSSFVSAIQNINRLAATLDAKDQECQFNNDESILRSHVDQEQQIGRTRIENECTEIQARNSLAQQEDSECKKIADQFFSQHRSLERTLVDSEQTINRAVILGQESALRDRFAEDSARNLASLVAEPRARVDAGTEVVIELGVDAATEIEVVVESRVDIATETDGVIEQPMNYLDQIKEHLKSQLGEKLFSAQGLNEIADLTDLLSKNTQVNKAYQANITLFKVGIAGTATFGVIGIITAGAIAAAFIFIPGLNVVGILAITAISVTAAATALTAASATIATIGHYRNVQLANGKRQVNAQANQSLPQGPVYTL